MDPIVSARIYIGTGLSEPSGHRAPGKYGRHLPVIDPVDVQAQVHEIVSQNHAGFTVIPGRGSWEGRGEPSLVVEMWESEAQASDFHARVQRTARTLVEALDQLAVAVVTTENGRQVVQYLNTERADQGATSHRYRRQRSA